MIIVYFIVSHCNAVCVRNCKYVLVHCIEWCWCEHHEKIKDTDTLWMAVCVCECVLKLLLWYPFNIIWNKYNASANGYVYMYV